MRKNYKIKNKRIKHCDKGFSLVELIIVIAIMSILAAAVTPVVIYFIDKSRKAVDIETAQTLFMAADLAAASSDDDIMEGWRIATDKNVSGAVSRTTVNNSGHNTALDKNTSVGTYEIACVTWCRGVSFTSKDSKTGLPWENSQFKSTIDSGDNGDKQRGYTDEFLKNLYHNDGVGQVYGGNGQNKYDGYHENTMMYMKFKKDAGYGKPEVWMVCVRCDNEKPEIWIGDKNLNGRDNDGQKTHKVRPLYRIYPDPCAEYKTKH